MVDQVPTEYYIDESGNTGDLSTVKIDAYFSEQRMFALAAFGGSVDEAFIGQFGNLKSAHRLQGPEVKYK